MSLRPASMCPCIAVVTSLLLATIDSAAAEETRSVVWHRTADLSVGDAPGAAKLNVSWSPLVGLFGDHLRLGLGARLGAYFLRNGVAFGGPDARLVAPDMQAIALNLFAQARIRIVRGLEIGANIDVFGYGFGSSVVGDYQAPGSAFRPRQWARVSHLDLLKFGSGDRGQLDSEFFVGYRFGRVGLRAGVTHFSIELLTRRRLDNGINLFRHPFSGGFASVYYWY
jgi:hypothetical protein